MMDLLPALGLAVICIFSAFVRRFWGGWGQVGLTPIIWHYVKIVVVALVAFAIGFLINAWFSAVIFALGTTAAFLNPFHSKGQRMGKSGPSIWASIAYMSGSYAVYTSLTGVALALEIHALWPLFLAPTGLLASIGYLLGWYVLPPLFGGLTPDGGYAHKIALGGTDLIDGPPSIGEMLLGVILLAGLPIIFQLANHAVP